MNLSKKEITQLLDNITAVLEHCNVFIYLTGKYLTAYKVIIIIIIKKTLAADVFYPDLVWTPIPYTTSYFI